MERYCLFWHHNEVIGKVGIGIDDGAQLEAPAPYRVEKPVVFYGSSITEGGCATRVGNAYTALLSRWLDADMINYGFSGSAKGEPAMANYLKTLDMSAFVMDYDHNSNPQQLRERHQPFFRTIRKAQPQLPILLLSRPDVDHQPEEARLNRQTVLNTYRAALNRGDERVAFIDGATLFGTEHRLDCTVDTVHPNDLGFLRMAQGVYPVLSRLLRDAGYSPL